MFHSVPQKQISLPKIESIFRMNYKAIIFLLISIILLFIIHATANIYLSKWFPLAEVIASLLFAMVSMILSFIDLKRKNGERYMNLTLFIFSICIVGLTVYLSVMETWYHVHKDID